MLDILIRAGCFIAIIILGMVLRMLGFLKSSDFPLLAKICLKITLPCAIITSFSGKSLDAGMLTLALVSLVWGTVYMCVGGLMYRKQGRKATAFGMINLPSYNIGCFALPFIQGFLGPTGVMATSIFDTGNSVICLGGSFGFASMVQGGGGFSWKRLVLSLAKSPAFLSYVLMVPLCLMNVNLPGPVVQLASIIGSANTFLAMLMLGVGFRLDLDRKQLGSIARHLAMRYGLALIFGLIAWFLLPFSREIRQVLLILAFSPIGSAAPGFTAELGGDTDMASTINSMTIPISIVAMVSILLITS